MPSLARKTAGWGFHPSNASERKERARRALENYRTKIYLTVPATYGIIIGRRYTNGTTEERIQINR